MNAVVYVCMLQRHFAIANCNVCQICSYVCKYRPYMKLVNIFIVLPYMPEQTFLKMSNKGASICCVCVCALFRVIYYCICLVCSSFTKFMCFNTHLFCGQLVNTINCIWLSVLQKNK